MDDDEFFECQEFFSSEATNVSKIPDKSEESSEKDKITNNSSCLHTDINNREDKVDDLDLDPEVCSIFSPFYDIKFL